MISDRDPADQAQSGLAAIETKSTTCDSGSNNPVPRIRLKRCRALHSHCGDMAASTTLGLTTDAQSSVDVNRCRGNCSRFGRAEKHDDVGHVVDLDADRNHLQLCSERIEFAIG